MRHCKNVINRVEFRLHRTGKQVNKSVLVVFIGIKILVKSQLQSKNVKTVSTVAKAIERIQHIVILTFSV